MPILSIDSFSYFEIKIKEGPKQIFLFDIDEKNDRIVEEIDMSSITNVLNDYLSDMLYDAVITNKNRFVLVINNIKDDMSHIQLINLINVKIAIIYNSTFTIAASNVIDSIDELRNEYKKCEYYLNYRLNLGKNSFIDQEL